MEIKRLIVRRTKAGSKIVLQARKETAEFYGWTNHFEEDRGAVIEDPAGGGTLMVGPVLRRSQIRGGRSIVISRSASKQGRKSTYSNQFRISRDATIPDLAKVAKFTDVDWNWMETPAGERRSREKWLALHEAWTQ